MRIITRGTAPEDTEYRVTCLKCITVFEFQRHEAKHVSDQRDGDYLRISCPVCNHHVTVTL